MLRWEITVIGEYSMFGAFAPSSGMGRKIRNLSPYSIFDFNLLTDWCRIDARPKT